MAFYQDAKGNYRSGEDPTGKSNYNYVNTNGQYVNNLGSSGPVYSPATQQQQTGIPYQNNVGIPAAPKPSTGFQIGNGLMQGGYGAPQAAQQAPQTVMPSQTMNPAGMGAAAGAKTGPLYDGQGKLVGTWLPGGGFAPASQGGSAPAPMGAGAMPGGAPATPSAANSTRIDVLTPQQKADIKTQLDARIAKQTTVANQTKTGFQTSYDRLAATTKDDRVIQDSSFQRNTNPFSGATDYRASMMDRERARTDREGQQDLQTRLANVDLTLADYVNATDADRVKMEADVLKAERDYGVQQDQLGLQQAGLTGYLSNGQRTLAGQGQDNSNAYQKDALALQKAGLTGSLDGQQTVAGRQADASIAASQAGLTGYNSDGTRTLAGQTADQQKTYQDNTYNLQLREQHVNEASGLSTKYGIEVQPKDDYQLMLDQVEGLPTVAQKTAEQQRITNQKTEAWKIVEFLGKVPDLYADLLGVPAGTQTQKAKELAADIAHKNRTQSNAETKTAWDVNPNNPSNQAKETPANKMETAETYSKYLAGVAQYANDPLTGGKTLSNPETVANAIESSKLSLYEKYRSYLAYDIPWDDPIPKP